jgi:hypothetical protein
MSVIETKFFGKGSNIHPRRGTGFLLRALTVFVAVLLFSTAGYAQTRQRHADQRNTQIIEKLFTQISEGISRGEINLFAEYFSNQTYLSLSSGQNGYYSANQAFYIIQEYFKLHQPVQFRFTAKNLQKLPYATGVFQYETGGRKRTAQVFISLMMQAKTWQISQFTIR